MSGMSSRVRTTVLDGWRISQRLRDKVLASETDERVDMLQDTGVIPYLWEAAESGCSPRWREP